MTLFVFLLGLLVGAATIMLIDLLTAVFVLVHMQREAKKKENKQ